MDTRTTAKSLFFQKSWPGIQDNPSTCSSWVGDLISLNDPALICTHKSRKLSTSRLLSDSQVTISGRADENLSYQVRSTSTFSFALVCHVPPEPRPARYAIIPALLSSPFCPLSLCSGVMLHPQSGQAIFVGPHSSGMMDSAGFVAAMFEVIVLPVSAVEKLQDKPIIQYRQYLMCFSAALPCVKGRLWSRWKIVFFFFAF